MKKLSRKTFEKITTSLLKNARPLEQKIFMHEFFDGTKEDIFAELVKYQNEDGGFGHGLECDIRMPYSSPKVTSIGIGHLSRLDDLEEAQKSLLKAINYLESSFNHTFNRWFIASREINDYPHGPWWHFNEIEGLTLLDLDWGNANAGIIASLYKYRQYVKTLDVEQLVETAIYQIENEKSFSNNDEKHKDFVKTINASNAPDYVLNYINNAKVFDTKGEILSYIRLYSVLDSTLKERLEKRIEAAISQIIIYDEGKWEKEYVPMPLDFAASPNTNHFGICKEKIQNNLDFFVNLLEAEGMIELKWAKAKNYYIKERQVSYNEWVWIFTLEALRSLRNYKRIENQ